MATINVTDFFKNADPTQGPAPRNAGMVSIDSFFGPPREEPEPSALKRGALTVGSDFTATAGLVADVFGYDEAAQGFYNRAAEIAASRDVIPRRVGRIEDIKSATDVGVFALETLLENAPLLASIAIPGIGAAKVAGFGGRAALAKTATREAAEEVAKRITRRKQVVGTLGAFMADVGLQTGESVQIAQHAGGDPADIRVVGAGLGKGALDFIPILKLAKMLGISKGIPLGAAVEKNVTRELVHRGFIKRAIGNMGTLIAYEVPTEVSQEIINIALDRSISQFEGQLTPEEKSQLMNAAGGAAAFGLLGIPAAVVRPSQSLRPATEEELHAADAAAEERPQLLLPPPPIRVTPSGIALLPGQEVKEVPYDPAIDTPKTGTAVAEAVKRALGRTRQQEPPHAMLVGATGVEFGPLRDTQADVADAIRQIPEMLRTPTEQNIVVVEDARQEAIRQDEYNLKSFGEHQQDYPVVIQTLLQARDDTYLNPGWRRSTDGQLTAAGKKRIKAIDKNIVDVANKLGLPNPLESTQTLTIEDAEEQVQLLNAQPEKIPDPQLTPAESALLAKLEEKDTIEGLTDREEIIRERLISKRQGERDAERQKLSAEEVMELRQLGNELGDAESIQVRHKSDEEARKDIIFEINQNIADLEKIDRGDFTDIQSRHAFAHDEIHEPNIEELRADILKDIRRLNQELKAITLNKPISVTERLLAEAMQEREQLHRQKEFYAKPPPDGARFGATHARLKKAAEDGLAAVEKRIARLTKHIDVRRSRGEGRGIPVREAATLVQHMTSHMQIVPNYILGHSGDPKMFVNRQAERVALSKNSKGVVFLDEPQNVYIFTDKIDSVEDLVTTVLHETLAHFGMRAYFAPDEFNAILQRTYETHGDKIQEMFGVPKDRREAREFAEEYIARIAEDRSEMSLLNRIIAALRKVFRKIRPKMKFTDNDIRFMLKDVSKFLTAQVPGRNRSGLRETLENESFLEVLRRADVENVMPSVDTFRNVWGSKFASWVLTPLQMAERFNMPGAMDYINQVQLWEARRGKLTKPVADLAERWRKLPREESERLAKMTLEISERSDELGRRLTDQELVALAQKHGASQTVFKMWKEVDQSFVDMLNHLQSGMEQAAIRNAVQNHPNPQAEMERLNNLWTQDGTKKGRTAFFDAVAADTRLRDFHLGDRLIQIENEMDLLRSRNYFPRMRFGQYAIVVRAMQDQSFQGKSFKGPKEGSEFGEVLTYETFETQKDRSSRLEEMKRQFGDSKKFRLQLSYVTDEAFSFLGMPPALYLELQNTLNLTEGQQEMLKNLYFRYSPGKAFLRHLTKRKGIAGFSTDAMRVYASYMMNAANHIARVEYHEAMSNQLSVMRDAARTAQEGTRLGIVQEYFARHFKYIMNPEEDLAKLRAVGFLWYLGFNVKSAFVNLTQVPMVAYPFLAAHYGDGQATAALIRAYKSVMNKNLGRSVFDKATDEDLARGIEERFLDESFAATLAGLGESDVLQRLMPSDKNMRLLNDVSYYGAFLFKHAEKFNREVVFIAARELELKRNPGNREEAYLAARKAVQTTMFEYAKWNRAQFMRGKKSVFFLFWQYMQHLAFMAYGGEGKGPALRTWMMLMFAAGLQGLPFAENFLDIFDFGATEVREALGVDNPRVALRDDLHEFMSNLTDRPDLIMHGLSRYYGLGPVHLLAALGAPIPHVDTSGSLSAGRVLPGTREAFGAERDPNEKFGRTLAEVLGPVVGMGYGMWKALESNDPDKWKVWERAMPTVLSGASKAVRRETRGEESFRGGGAVAEFDPHDMEHRLENLMQAFGFATTRVNQRFELRASQESLKQYWVIRRSAVMENFAYALLSEDDGTIASARRRLAQFNKEAPAPGLKINGETLKQSVQERFRRGHLREVGIPNEHAFRFLYQQLEAANPEGAPSI